MGEQSRRIDPEIPGPVKGITSKMEGLAGNTRTPVRSYRRGASGSQSPFGAFTGEKSNALNSLRSLTYGGNPLMSAGSSQLMDTLGGRYLNPGTNPYLSGTADIISEKAKQGFGDALGMIDSRSNLGGSLFSTMNRGAKRDATSDFSENLTNPLTALYGGNYNMERGNQMGALGQGFQYGQQPFANSLSLLGAESIPRSVGDQSGQFDYNEFLRQNEEGRYQAELPFSQYMQLLSGYPLAYPQYTPGRSPFQDASSIISPLAMLGAGFASGGYF